MLVKKKPVTINAYQVTPGGNWIDTKPTWLRDAILAGTVYWSGGDPGHYTVETHHGKAVAKVGDWIMRGVDGEVYPCLDSVFQATYEPAAADEPPAEVCRTCKHWSPTLAPGPTHERYGAPCTLIKRLGMMTMQEWVQAKGAMDAALIEGVGTLWTLPEFGCKKWERGES